MSNVVVHMFRAVAMCGIALSMSTVGAQQSDWKKVDAVLGRTATVSGDVHRYGFPRSAFRSRSMA